MARPARSTSSKDVATTNLAAREGLGDYLKTRLLHVIASPFDSAQGRLREAISHPQDWDFFRAVSGMHRPVVILWKSWQVE